MMGVYNDYNYRSAYTSLSGTTCENNVNYDGVIFGKIICPVEGFDYFATYCCGPPLQQYCCTQSEFMEYGEKGFFKYEEPETRRPEFYETKNKSHHKSVIFIILGIVLGVGLLIAIIILISCILCSYFKGKPKDGYDQAPTVENKVVVRQDLVRF